jgi:hypothetical protein
MFQKSSLEQEKFINWLFNQMGTSFLPCGDAPQAAKAENDVDC